jgi:hypothetical protein
LVSNEQALARDTDASATGRTSCHRFVGRSNLQLVEVSTVVLAFVALCCIGEHELNPQVYNSNNRRS